MSRPESVDFASLPALRDTDAYSALLRREQQLDAIQQSLGWRLLSYYGPYKRRLVLPAWRYVRGAARRWLKMAPAQQPTPYETWADFADRFRGATHHPVTAAVADEPNQTSVSIIVTVDPASQPKLEALISSLLAQRYIAWELCVAFVTRSAAAHTHATSCQIGVDDPRIRIAEVRYATHAAASNAAIALARGDIVALVPPTLVLTCDALGSAVRAFADTAGDVVYGDEDLLDDHGRRHSPQLKPGWSPDLLLSWMYWSRLVFYRRTFLKQLGPLRVEVEGAHEYDLALRAVEQPARVVHLPRILSHVHAPSLTNPEALTSTQRDAGRQALEAALSRRGIVGTVRWHSEGSVYRVQRTITASSKVSIIIPTRDGLDMLQRCLRAVEVTDHPSYEVIIIDNGSIQEATLAFLAETRHKVIRSPGPFNFSRLNNLAVTHTNGEYLVFLNNDTEPCSPNWLRALEEHAQRPEVGAVGAKLLYPNGRIQHAGIALGIGGLAGHPYRFQRSAPESIRNVSAVTAACLMMRRETFDAIAGFDECLPVNSNDVDLCLRLRERGYLVVYTPHAVLRHYESQTRGTRATPDDAWLMTRRWREVLLADPYYSPQGDVAEETGGMDLSKPDGMSCLYRGASRADGSLHVAPGTNAGQCFFATGSDLCAIVIRGTIAGEHPESALRLRVRESPTSRVDIRTVECSIVGRSPDEWWLCFEPIANSAERFWYFFIEVAEGHAMVLRRNAVVSDVMGPCFENHVPTHGMLLFQLYARAPYRSATTPP